MILWIRIQFIVVLLFSHFGLFVCSVMWSNLVIFPSATLAAKFCRFCVLFICVLFVESQIFRQQLMLVSASVCLKGTLVSVGILYLICVYRSAYYFSIDVVNVSQMPCISMHAHRFVYSCVGSDVATTEYYNCTYGYFCYVLMAAYENTLCFLWI